MKNEMTDHSNQIIQYQGTEIDLSRLADRLYLIKKICQIVVNPNRPFDYHSFHRRVDLIAVLERMLRTEFRNTRDMKHKVADFLRGYDLRKVDTKIRIRKMRKGRRLTQQQLAERLGYRSHVPIAQMETGTRPASKRVLAWLEEEKM
jgi:DNA-binding XRE family transcriptional regulator